MVFQTCVSEGRYKIFPFSGTHLTPKQIGAMSRSLACRAIFTSILLAGIPECELSNFPIRSAAETLLKIGVDIDKYPGSDNIDPSTDRFIEMMHWRRDVNLARAAGLPFTTNGLVRLTADKEVQLRSTIDGSFSQEQIIRMPNMPVEYSAEATVKPLSALSTSPDAVVAHAELKLKTKESSDIAEPKRSSTTNATSWPPSLQFWPCYM
ncbi:hypothetical protein GN244_ATG03318 [Phytophthora infestans]|uniref:Uncharacterized protein n=1 Tax=Phytophthora infestans TaxID=4787 RepID=A0A833TPR5_PHYIN|nr:hypothetical protein GN244_ATG03318 [Phytophthora infestans]KAF4147758.1 hypothetical protein GN958_ATG03113 [Phytophthora infestans]